MFSTVRDMSTFVSIKINGKFLETFFVQSQYIANFLSERKFAMYCDCTKKVSKNFPLIFMLTKVLMSLTVLNIPRKVTQSHVKNFLSYLPWDFPIRDLL